ncbi:MAG: acyl-CoA carboxylase subunit beta [Tepidisphaera sp.]|nr:acyl-CoA carboxylase subunit beta [Tepidisphaera sp.]
MSEPTLREKTQTMLAAEAKIRVGGGQSAIDRQHEKGRLTARERVEKLIDPGSFFQELGLWAAHEMYKEYGGAPAAGVVTGIGVVQGRRCMIIANDATVKAGAFFPMTCKKIIRAQSVAMMARLPLIYLVDSAGVFLPLQEDVFPDTDDFGRIFRNNSVISAMGIPQIAAIMGYCVAGGGYLPVLCDTLLMTEGSGLYLAGPALVKAAIGQEVTDEELGGASMHASISGTIDFKEKDDEACIVRLRRLVGTYELRRSQKIEIATQTAKKEMLEQFAPRVKAAASNLGVDTSGDFGVSLPRAAAAAANTVYEVFTDRPGTQYDVRDVIGAVVDSMPDLKSGFFDEYKSDYGQSLVCGYATIGGHACGIVANQKKLVQRTMASVGRHSVPTDGSESRPTKQVQMPGVIYDDSADKAARFIMDCNQRKIPIVFLHDTTGFMVGRDSEQGGIIRAGAKMVNAMSNCVVPKIVVIMGGSYGAGNYAMCGRAFDQFMAFAWPSAKCAVMGANQATGVLTTIEEASRKRKGETIDEASHEKIYSAIHAAYTQQAAITHAASRGWIDRMIEPHKTREELIAALDAANQGWDYSQEFKTGVLQT